MLDTELPANDAQRVVNNTMSLWNTLLDKAPNVVKDYLKDQNIGLSPVPTPENLEGCSSGDLIGACTYEHVGD